MSVDQSPRWTSFMLRICRLLSVSTIRDSSFLAPLFGSVHYSSLIYGPFIQPVKVMRWLSSGDTIKSRNTYFWLLKTFVSGSRPEKKPSQFLVAASMTHFGLFFKSCQDIDSKLSHEISLFLWGGSCMFHNLKRGNYGLPVARCWLHAELSHGIGDDLTQPSAGDSDVCS